MDPSGVLGGPRRVRNSVQQLGGVLVARFWMFSNLDYFYISTKVTVNDSASEGGSDKPSQLHIDINNIAVI